MKSAFVTGASYGIGAACALALARDGFHVAVSELDPKNLADTVAKITAGGVRAAPVELDLRSLASIERAMTEVLAAFGQLDVLVNSAGAPSARPPSLEMTGAVAYLVSPQAAYITGQTLLLDGGLTSY